MYYIAAGREQCEGRPSEKESKLVRARIFKLLSSPKNRFQGTYYVRLHSMAGRYYNSIPTWFLAPPPHRLFKNSSTVYGPAPLHSPRTGGASDAFRNKIPGHLIDRQGRWKSSSTKYCYLRFEERKFVKVYENRRPMSETDLCFL